MTILNPGDDAGAVSSILDLLRERTGTDFTRYRAATVHRRIANRMISVGARSFGDYLALLEASEGEALSLLSRVSIKVSRFYRNRASFDLLREKVLSDLASRPYPARIWSVGCGCGEEAYTLAMLLEERGLPGYVDATDIDPSALEAARRAVFPEEAAAELPAHLASRFLVPVRLGSRRMLGVRPEVRERVRFARADLLEAPASAAAYDLVSCRNVLIYLQGVVREEACAKLRTAVRRGGYLFLGEAEWPPESVLASLHCLGHAARLFRVRGEVA